MGFPEFTILINVSSKTNSVQLHLIVLRRTFFCCSAKIFAKKIGLVIFDKNEWQVGKKQFRMFFFEKAKYTSSYATMSPKISKWFRNFDIIKHDQYSWIWLFSSLYFNYWKAWIRENYSIDYFTHVAISERLLLYVLLE